MRPEHFDHFLNINYRGERSGRPLSLRPRRDALSRCQRIETVLGVELDFRLDGRMESRESLLNYMDQYERDFKIDGDLRSGMASLKNAAKRYHDFRSWERSRETDKSKEE